MYNFDVKVLQVLIEGGFIEDLKLMMVLRVHECRFVMVWEVSLLVIYRREQWI